MSAVRYLPGEGWLSVVRSGVVVLVPAATAPELTDRLWNQLGENPNLQAVLPIVAGGFGQGLESMPPFGVVSYTDRLHVLLRGDVHLRVGTDDGGAPVELSGQQVTTWVERIVDGGGNGFTLSGGSSGAGGYSGAGGDTATLPLESGIVRASVVSVGSFGPAGRADPVRAEPDVFDPERAVTGAAEAEELATINPSLYLSSTDGVDEDGQRAADGADSIGEDQNQQAEPDPELQTTGYDHLWDQTVMRRVEDAAVRPPEEANPSDEIDVQQDAAQVSEQPSQPSERLQQAELSEQSESPELSEQSKPKPEPSTPPADASPIPLAAPGQLIDSVPWARKSAGTGGTATGPVTSNKSATPITPDTSITPDAPAPKQPRDLLDAEDHDGQTIMRSDLQGPPSQQPVQPAAEPRPGTGPLVLARLCGQGHANPPEASDCKVCSQPLDGEPREVRRPSLGTMRISTGEVVDLDQSLIIGRQPSVSRVQGRGMPKLVQVTSSGGDISRSHVEVRLDGWHVLLCDLKATNGTVLIRAGQPPRRLGESETAFLLDGDVAQLGDDIFLRFEGLR
ncbi:hypothetical protein ASH00_11270 [Arthrobacter sp. Soil782]|uniref:FHA domain-containing protein n=1 Tax=Arthrobacter sp. Soil782 TaxID=1736410 RepID=UPI0006F793AD|nr:FHA domain-containing protein [Arthrobacter sp. Soil782]KRF05025.1 hypothetical protein ASH00_11270 [Arthrobacter sp. Soil782]